jgi:hypothetical protein
MKKLEDIPKQNVYEVPEGYFDKLPGVIQARVAKPSKALWLSPIFKLATPVAALAIAVFIWFNVGSNETLEEQINEIQTEQLVVYLDQGDLPSELVTEDLEWNEEDLMELEEGVFSEMEPIDVLEEEISVEP